MEVLKSIDKSKFGKIIKACGVVFPASFSSKYLKDYKDYLLNMEKIPNIAKEYKENDKRLLLLSTKYQKNDQSGWPEALKILINENKYDTIDYDLKLGYDDLNMQEILGEVLPQDVVVPTGFETVGTIAHLNLRNAQLPYRHIIGQVLLDKNPKLSTVVNKTEKLSNVFRTPELEIIAGKDSLDTELKEGGCIFKLNFEKVYWNSRLQSERDRVLNKFKKGETLCDMFCGIGPLVIRAAKKGLFILGNDLNPDCFEYLKINAQVNKVEKMIEYFNMDAREFIREIVVRRENKVHFDHVYMNLPMDALEFLDVFYGIFKGQSTEMWNENTMPYIYVNGFDTGKDMEEVEQNLTKRALKAFNIGENINLHPEIHAIKDISDKKKMYCMIFRLPKEIGFGEIGRLTDDGYESVEKKLKTD